MRNGPTLRLGPPHRSPTDGWLGIRELPGYRAGNIVARLDDLPEVDPDHLYFDLLLLDAGGHTQDYHCGPCFALGRQQSLDERSRFVRVVAELVRHAPGDDVGLTAIGQVLTFIRERGVETDRLIMAAQLLDNVCGERAVSASLSYMLELSLGEEEAHLAMCEVVVDLARTSGAALPGAGAAGDQASGSDVDNRVRRINSSGLEGQVSYLVRTVGKERARGHLRDVIYFEIVPTPALFGV
jgi:hypothetical protein